MLIWGIKKIILIFMSIMLGINFHFKFEIYWLKHQFFIPLELQVK